MKLLKSHPVLVTLILVVVIIIGSFGFYISTNKQAPVSTCLITLFGQNKNPFIYEINSKDIASVSNDEANKLKSDKRRVALNAFYKNDKITLGMICEGCVKAEVSFGYQPTTASNWCSMALTSKKVETGDQFYHQIDELKTTPTDTQQNNVDPSTGTYPVGESPETIDSSDAYK